MTGVVISFVVDTDRHVQRAFDWCAHALMRAGLSKAQIRLAINVGSTAAFTMAITLRAAWYLTPIWFAVFSCAWSAMLAVFAQIEWHQDQRAAARGMLSKADEGPHLGDKAWGILWSTCGLIAGPPKEMIAACGRALAESGNLCMVAFWLLLAAHGYLAKTPPTPPARRRRVLVPISPSAS